jgi:hypothetical protein
MTELCAALHLSPRNRANVRDIPADARERLYSGNDPDNKKRNMKKCRDNCPEKYQDAADARNGPEDRMHDRRDNVEEKPRATKDDRLHRVEAHERIVLFEDIKNDAADQRNAGDGCSHIGR